MLPLGLSACRSDRVCKGRGVRRRCPRKWQFHFLNKKWAFSAVNTVFFARPKVWRKTNGFLNASPHIFQEKNKLSFLLENKRGRHSREMALLSRRTVLAPVCGQRYLRPFLGGNEKRRFLSRTFNILYFFYSLLSV